jgi:hypothetical protein
MIVFVAVLLLFSHGSTIFPIKKAPHFAGLAHSFWFQTILYKHMPRRGKSLPG